MNPASDGGSVDILLNGNHRPIFHAVEPAANSPGLDGSRLGRETRRRIIQEVERRLHEEYESTSCPTGFKSPGDELGQASSEVRWLQLTIQIEAGEITQRGAAAGNSS